MPNELPNERRRLTFELRCAGFLFALLLAVDFVILGVAVYLRTVLLTWPFMLSVFGTYGAAKEFASCRQRRELAENQPELARAWVLTSRR